MQSSTANQFRKRGQDEWDFPDVPSLVSCDKNPSKRPCTVQSSSFAPDEEVPLFDISTINTLPKHTAIRCVSSAQRDELLLAEDFQPHNWHVIYGRAKCQKEHIGNRRLRVLIAATLQSYVEAPSRREKSHIIDEVCSKIQCYGGFVKKTAGGRWRSIGPTQAREKVGHSFRDCMKIFKGEKPKDKKVIWVEAQNAIFANMQLNHPSSPSSVLEEPMEVQTEGGGRPDPLFLYLYDGIDCSDISDDDEPLEWLTASLL